jgi:hypothetical protein
MTKSTAHASIAAVWRFIAAELLRLLLAILAGANCTAKGQPDAAVCRDGEPEKSRRL